MFSGIYIAVCILVSVDTSTCSTYSTLDLDLVSHLKDAKQSSTHGSGAVAGRAVDGGTNGDFGARSCTHTAAGLINPWWYVNLGSSTAVSKIVIYNRVGCCVERLTGAVVRVGENNVSPFTGNIQCGSTITRMMSLSRYAIELTCNPPIEGQYVSVYLPGSVCLTLCEVKVYKDIGNPVLLCSEDINVSTGVDQTLNPVTWSDPKVMDNGDTDVIATCTPSSGSTFEVGLTQVTCSATDASGNEGNCLFVVNIEDDEEHALSCPPHITVDSDVDQFENPVTWREPTVTDNMHTGMSAKCTPVNGSVFDVGSTIVTCLATDGTGNKESCSFVVHVTGQKLISDVGNPTVMCPHNITGSTGVDQSLNPVTWSDPKVMGNVDTHLMATCAPSSGSTFEVGLTKVTCSATDSAGNEGKCSFAVSITSKQLQANTHSGNKSDNTRDYLTAVVVVLCVVVFVMASAFVIVCRHFKSKYNDSTFGITMKMEDNNVA